MTNLELFTKEETTKILVSLGIPANLLGFKYLQQCILEVVKRPSSIKKVTKDLYPNVGKMFDVNGAIVERSMRHATEIGYNKTGLKKLYSIYNLEECQQGYKPTNCEIIAMIAENLRIRAMRLGLISA